jgi:MYXO-CTERM domain-containing protein
MPPAPEKAIEDADVVFEARPFGMTNDGQRARYSFEVDRVWKGELGPSAQISTALHSATCGRSFQIGTQYVVYARRSASGELTDNLCSRTRVSASAAEDLEVLGPGHDAIEAVAPPTDPGPEPTEPPRIAPAPLEPPPGTPSPRGCAVEKPHASAGATALALLGLFAVASGRRRTVRSLARPRPGDPRSP